MTANANGSHLQFFEKRPFRNLIHLYLPISEAPLETVLFHINRSVVAQQEKIAFQAAQIDALHHELSGKDSLAEVLRGELRQLNEKLAEQENLIFARNLDEVKQLQNAIKSLTESKDNEKRHHMGVISGLESDLEALRRENRLLTDRMSACAKDVDAYMREGQKLRQQITALREEKEQFVAAADNHKIRDRKNELNALDLKRQLKDTRDKLNDLEKQKSDLIAELEAEKIVCHTKRNALQIATEEITKANDIIVKQSKELADLRRKSDARADVALRQEMILTERDHEVIHLRKQCEIMEKELKTYAHTTQQLSKNIEEIKEFSDKMEEQYKQSESITDNPTEMINH